MLYYGVMIYDLIIIGGGPAGVAAGVYASRKQLQTLLITSDFGGQSIVSETIYNWIGEPAIGGVDLAKKLRAHLESLSGDSVTIEPGSLVTKLIQNSSGTYTVTTNVGAAHESKSILIASGSGRRKLDVIGADIYEHKGLTYCASCDGPLFAGQDVAVIGGGNAGFESAAQLLAYAKSVTLLNRSSILKADPVTIEKVTSNPNMRVIKNAIPTKVDGDTFVSSLTYTDAETGTENTLPVQGIFVEIGAIPNTAFAKDILDIDDAGRIVIDPWTQKTSAQNIWAAGDCTNILYHQNNIAAGDAVRALEDIYITLKTK